MAPKRKAKGSGAATTTTTTTRSTTTTTSPRRTRSATAAGKRVAPPPETKAPPPRPLKKPKRAAAEETKDSKGKGKRKAYVDKEPLAPPPISSGDGDASKTIIVEACKQCNSFKTRAMKVKDGLESAVPGVTVTINPEKPRRGCFEIREDGGKVFVSLLDMPRPFKPMKDLDMDKVIVDIAKKIT